ncbi:MAG: nucleoside kinase [Oscillospiraceae bacterium]|nr:nucleoside kinase [Oscillospiraceae bacterium]
MATYSPKRRIQISQVNELARDAGFIKRCEEDYTARVNLIADEVIRSGCHVVMASGPSASGKTTSSLRLASRLRALGTEALVVSLDDFFKNIADYPLTEEGKPDLESVYALDLELINESIAALLRDGKCELPQFDFKTQSRRAEKRPISLGKKGVAVIEGIHALNPLLTQSVDGKGILSLYIGLREEFYEGEARIIATRDLRITRRIVRDLLFRGYTAEETLSVWRHIQEGEDKWIKPFRNGSDFLLDSSVLYEPCVFSRIMSFLRSDEGCGGTFRAQFLKLCEGFERFAPLEDDEIPPDSLLREFIGGLEL